jgi:hypothetical protein
VKILAIGRLREGLDPQADIAPRAKAELRVLWQLYGEDFVREMYSPAGPGAVLVIEAPAVDDAAEALAGLPLVAGGVIEFEYIELQPFRAFEALFAAR